MSECSQLNNALWCTVALKEPHERATSKPTTPSHLLVGVLRHGGLLRRHLHGLLLVLLHGGLRHLHGLLVLAHGLLVLLLHHGLLHHHGLGGVDHHHRHLVGGSRDGADLELTVLLWVSIHE